jgi:NAD(P)-dependent dehydrogenase (short-subunit alcohol dehydrogenase family)
MRAAGLPATRAGRIQGDERHQPARRLHLPYGGFYVYGAAKAGLNRLMRSVAIDLKDGGIIHPGCVRTAMGGPDADNSPEESAAVSSR